MFSTLLRNLGEYTKAYHWESLYYKKWTKPIFRIETSKSDWWGVDYRSIDISCREQLTQDIKKKDPKAHVIPLAVDIWERPKAGGLAHDLRVVILFYSDSVEIKEKGKATSMGAWTFITGVALIVAGVTLMVLGQAWGVTLLTAGGGLLIKVGIITLIIISLGKLILKGAEEAFKGIKEGIKGIFLPGPGEGIASKVAKGALLLGLGIGGAILIVKIARRL